MGFDALKHVFRLLAVTSLFIFGHCQSIHTVMVGDIGSFYNPPTTSALTGDIVRFVFAGQAHTVTQSSGAAPCVPLPGGFDSGIAGVGPGLSGTAPTWDLIVNTTDPIWFYCQLLMPFPHCESGMVGVINPPSQDAYLAYVAAAKALTFKPTDPISTGLTGVGAFATAPPTVTDSPTSSPPETPTSQSEQPTSNASSPNTAIIGGAVGGGVAVVIVLSILTYCLVRSRQRERRELAQTDISTRPAHGGLVSTGGRRTQFSDAESAGPLMHLTSPPVTGTRSSFDGHPESRGHSPGAGKALTHRPSNGTMQVMHVTSSGASDSYEEESIVSSRALYAPSHPQRSPPAMLSSQRDYLARPVQQRIVHPYGMGGDQQDDDEQVADPRDADYQSRKIAQEVANLLDPRLRLPSGATQTPYPSVVRELDQQRPARQLPQPPDPLDPSRRSAAPPRYHQ